MSITVTIALRLEVVIEMLDIEWYSFQNEVADTKLKIVWKTITETSW
ncbi:hypothetical protein HMPREF0789_1852 [Staphylococcus epidermidis BCM-HMP0060]|nr:hypothetical protein HMPREF0789_1852 [Staphylococcus epidermidis BCM-HMP0060]